MQSSCLLVIRIVESRGGSSNGTSRWITEQAMSILMDLACLIIHLDEPWSHGGLIWCFFL